MKIESSGGDESQNDCIVYKNIETPPEITMVKQTMPLSSKESCNSSTMGFFFKANAKSLLSNVKRALESKEEEGEEKEKEEEETEKGEKGEKKEKVEEKKGKEKGKKDEREQEENDSQIINARIRPVRKSGRVKVSHATREEPLINLVDDVVIIADRSDSNDSKIIDLSVDTVYQATAPLLTHRKKDKYRFLSKQQATFKALTDDSVIDPLLMELAGRKTLSSTLSMLTNGEFKVRFVNYNASLSTEDAGNCHLYPIQPDETIWKIYKTHCQINSLDYHKVELLYGGLKIYPSATLATLGEGLKPIVDIVAVKYVDFEKIQLEETRKRKQLLELVSFGNDDTNDNNSRTTGSPETQLAATMATASIALQTKMINFGIKMAGIDESLKISFSSDQPLRVLLDNLERDDHIKTGERARTRLLFDGDILCLEKTPQDLQLEDGDLLDIGILKNC